MSAKRLTTPSSTMNRIALLRGRSMLAGAVSLIMVILRAFSGMKRAARQAYLISRSSIPSDWIVFQGSPSRLGKARNGFLDGAGKREHQARDCRDVIKMGVRQM